MPDLIAEFFLLQILPGGLRQMFLGSMQLSVSGFSINSKVYTVKSLLADAPGDILSGLVPIH